MSGAVPGAAPANCGQPCTTAAVPPLAGAGALPGCFRIGLSNARHWEHARPGAWNDPDYLLLGVVGDARVQGEGLYMRFMSVGE